MGELKSIWDEALLKETLKKVENKITYLEKRKFFKMAARKTKRAKAIKLRIHIVQTTMKTKEGNK